MKSSVLLPVGVTVVDVANASRQALDDLLALDPNDKFGVSRWLVSSYREATRFGPKRIRVDGSAPHPHVATMSLGAVVRHAQGVARGAIDAACVPGAEALLAAIPSTLDVIHVHDTLGGHGFAPVDAPHERLAARALSLLLTDFLTRPDDYVCDRRRLPSGERHIAIPADLHHHG